MGDYSRMLEKLSKKKSVELRELRQSISYRRMSTVDRMTQPRRERGIVKKRIVRTSPG